MTTTLTKLTEDQVKALSRGELIEMAKTLGHDSPVKTKSADLVDFILESQQAGKPMHKRSPQLQKAYDDYAAARERIRKAIAASQTAMQAYRADKNDSTKAAYDAAKAEHKDAVAHIKVVRTTYKNLVKAEDEKQ